MKKILLSALLLVASAANAKLYTFIADKSSADEVNVDQTNVGLNVSFHVKGMETDEVKGIVPLKEVQKMKFDGLSTTNRVGQPSLPYHSVVVADRPENVVVKYKLGQMVKLNDVTPAPSPRIPLRNEEYKEDYQSLNWVSYNKASSKLYEVEFLGDFRGTPLTKVTFFPMQYDAKNGTRVYPEIEYKVFSKVQAQLENFTAPETVIEKAEVNKRYLIVTPVKFAQAMGTFVEWKKAQGYEVDVVTLEDAGATADKVKAFLQARYDNADTKFSYALFVGNETVFPCFYRPTSSSSRTPTDLPYFTMGGTTDTIADVFYGRFVVSTEKDIANQTKKIMDYEKGEYADSFGLNRAVGIASNEGSSPSDVDYVKAMAKPLETTFGTTYTYGFQGQNTATVKVISEALNKGAMWVNYVGHGSGYAWASTNDNFGNAAIKKLNNAGKVKPVIIDVACMNGKFANGYFGERFMNEVDANGNPIGAAMYLGGSVNVSWHPPAIMARAISEKIASDKIETTGEAIFAGQMALSATWTNKKDVQDNMTWYHIFGDPAMKLRMKP